MGQWSRPRGRPAASLPEVADIAGPGPGSGGAQHKQAVRRQKYEREKHRDALLKEEFNQLKAELEGKREVRTALKGCFLGQGRCKW